MRSLVIVALLALTACAAPVKKVDYTKVTAIRFYACMGAFQWKADQREGTWLAPHKNIEQMFTEGPKKFGFSKEEIDAGIDVFAESAVNFADLSKQQQTDFLTYCLKILGAEPIQLEPKKQKLM